MSVTVRGEAADDRARSVRDLRARRHEDDPGHGRRSRGPSAAYIYDWNILPIGQLLWLKELETYMEFPPMQDPASYSLDQVLAEKKMPAKTPSQ